MKKIEVVLNEEMIAKLKTLSLTRSDKTESELIQQCVERGLYDLNYRTRRNKQQWSEFKAWKDSNKEN